MCVPPMNDWSVGFIGIDLFPAPVKLTEAASGFAMSSPTGNLRTNEDGELEADALFAVYPPLANEVNLTLSALVAPPRDDPAYREGELGPTEDSATHAVRALYRYSTAANKGQTPLSSGRRFAAWFSRRSKESRRVP